MSRISFAMSSTSMSSETIHQIQSVLIQAIVEYPRESLGGGVMAVRIACAFLVAFLAAAAQAQTWPSKPVRYVVPFPPAGATDILARIIAERISEPLYTKRSFSFEHDLAATAMIARMPNVMVVNPSVPAKSVAEFIALAKSKPGELNFAASGSGTSLHMAGEMFKMMTGVDIVFIPYKGSGPALADLMGGQVDLMFDNLTAAIGHIRSGKLRALAVTTSTRYPELPDLPTMQEAGIPGYEVTAWFGIMLPKGAPKDIVLRINGEVNKALVQAEMRERLLQQGAIATAWTPEQFGSFIHDEVVKWAKVVRASGAKVE